MDISIYYENLLDGVIISDAEGIIQYCNDSAGAILGLPVRRLKGKPFKNFAAQSSELVKKFEAFVETKGADDFSPYSEIPLTDGRGVKKMIQTATWFDKETSQIVFYIRDMTLEGSLHAKYRQELLAKEELIKMLDRKVFELQFLFDLSASAAVLEDADFNQHKIFERIIVSLPFEAILTFKYRNDDVTLDGFHAVDAKRSNRDLVGVLTRHLKTLDIKAIPDGSHFTFETPEAAVLLCFIAGQNGDITVYCYAFAQKHRDLIKINEELLDKASQQIKMIVENQVFFRQSITDEKTKLFNQRYFKYRFEYERKKAEKHAKEFAVIIFDIDFFKKVNDTHGHLVGDVALIEVANTIRSCVRNIDIASRFGGEEFAVLALETAEEGSMMVAERVRTKVSEMKIPLEGGGFLQMTISAGVSVYPRHGHTMPELMEKADQALYKAKQGGRNRVVLAN